jgi:hypothetical protein
MKNLEKMKFTRFTKNLRSTVVKLIFGPSKHSTEGFDWSFSSVDSVCVSSGGIVWVCHYREISSFLGYRLYEKKLFFFP